MSVSIILVPLAVAAVAALHNSRRDQDDTGRTVCHVGTRMRDDNLLGDALSDTGAMVTRTSPDQIRAAWRGVVADFTRGPDGIWSAHLVGDVDEERGRSIVAGVDVAYGLRVQSVVLTKLRERAPAAGLHLQSENVEEDSSVTVVLTVQQGA